MSQNLHNFTIGAPVNSIDGNVALNKALWHLAEALKAAKTTGSN